MFKLEGSDSIQKMILFAGGGIFAALNLFCSFGPPEADQAPRVRIEDLQPGHTFWTNPELTWYERIFCRGYQHSDGCSYRWLHPIVEAEKNKGWIPPEGPPPSKVVSQSFHAQRSSTFGQAKITIK